MTSGSHPAAELCRAGRHLFLSPHYDDIALSAGGTVRVLADHGRTPETFILFGADPDASRPLSPFAQGMHEDWGFTASEVIARRQAEENVASTFLGSTQRLLPFRDAIYREDHYLSDDDLFGDPNAAENELPRQIVTALDLPERPDAGVRIYAPLGVGHHVDHLLAFRAGVLLANAGWDVWFYEDMPYALKPGAFDQRKEEIAAATSMEPHARVPVEAAWDTKIDAILSYPSQLETIFQNYVGIGTSRAEISEALQRYARSVGEGALAERFWVVKYASSRAGC